MFRETSYYFLTSLGLTELGSQVKTRLTLDLQSGVKQV